MNLLNQSKKVRRHMAMLTIVLLMLLPFAGIATLLLVAVIFSGSPPDGLGNHMAAGALLGIPAIFLVVGIIILARLRDGFSSSTRRRVFGYYVSLLAYCGFWLAGWGSRDGVTFTFFDLPAVLVITLLIAIPAVATMLTPADSE